MRRVALLLLLICAAEASRPFSGLLPPSTSPVNQNDSEESNIGDVENGKSRSRRNSDCFGEAENTALLETQSEAVPGEYGQFFMKLVPGVHGKLYGRSLVAPCRCEACAYVLDTLVMYLEEDTMGWFLPDDVEHVMQDRFCYGIKWIYRSACQHILSAYYEEIITMTMGHLTGVDMCRVLRFCPFHFSSGNWMWPQRSPLSYHQGEAFSHPPTTQ